MFKKRIILDPITDEPYLVRWFLLRTRFGGIKLHRILRADFGRDMHDHPWAFLSIVLRGSYVEEVPRTLWNGNVGPRHYVVKWLNFKRCTGVHRIVQVRGKCYTLVFTGPRVREWGFHTRRGWVQWRKYIDALRGAA